MAAAVVVLAAGEGEGAGEVGERRRTTRPRTWNGSRLIAGLAVCGCARV